MTTAPLSNLTATWNASGTTFNAIKMNVTDTASAAGSLLLDLQVGGSSKVRITKSGLLDFDAAGTGFLRDSGGGGLRWRINGTDRGAFGVGTMQIFGSANLLFGDSGDVNLARDAADTLAQRNGTNAQTFRVYNTFTDASNYERGRVGWETNTFVLGAQAAGTGTNRTTYLTSSGGTSAAQVRIGTDAGGGRVWFTPGNLSAWEMNSSGHFLAGVDNTYDIGASGANRPRNVHIAGYVSIGDGITAPGAGTGQARIYVDTADGDLKVVFADGTIKTIVTDT